MKQLTSEELAKIDAEVDRFIESQLVNRPQAIRDICRPIDMRIHRLIDVLRLYINGHLDSATKAMERYDKDNPVKE